jgi:hypothetical protein
MARAPGFDENAWATPSIPRDMLVFDIAESGRALDVP